MARRARETAGDEPEAKRQRSDDAIADPPVGPPTISEGSNGSTETAPTPDDSADHLPSTEDVNVADPKVSNPAVNLPAVSTTEVVKPDVISKETRFYFEPELYNRLNKLNEHFDASTGTATLHTLPFERTRWGPVKHGIADQSKILYLDGKPFEGLYWTKRSISLSLVFLT